MGPKLSRRQRLIETQNTSSLSLSLMSRSVAPPQRQEEPSSSSFGKRWSLVEVYRAARRHKEERLETLRRSRKDLDLNGDKTDVQRAEDLIAKCSKSPSPSPEALEDDSGDTEKGTAKNFDVSDHTASTEESTEAT